MKLFQDELVKNLPDYYKKEKDSNNYKILQLIGHSTSTFQSVLQELLDNKSIYDATGHALDLYGDIYDVHRGTQTEEEFRLAILEQIVLNRAGSDHESVIRAIATILNISPDTLQMRDGEKNGNVDILIFPFDGLAENGISSGRALELTKKVLPVGVGISKFKIMQTVDESVLFASTAVSHAEHFGLIGTLDDTYTVDAEVYLSTAVIHSEHFMTEGGA